MSNFRITPIGTCRIHTPLSRAVGRYPIEVDLRRNYGFVHTSDEALQQIRFLQGEKQFRPEVLPLVFRSPDAKVAEEQWEPADLHIVEISSAKRIASGPDTVQINFVYRHFADFFANTERSRRFWNRLREGHRGQLVEFLERQTAYQMMSEEDRSLLLSLSVEQQTFKAVKRDMAEILERLGREKVLFITHVNAATPDGERLPTRDRLIRWVKVAAEQLDARVFDPTEMMLDVGQDHALENGGLDLTHFTPGFSDTLYNAIHQAYVVPLLGSEPLAAGDERSRKIAEIVARVESTIELGDFFAGARELHAAIEEFADAVDLLRARGIVRSRIGDYRGALEDLSRPAPSRAPSDAMRLATLEAATAIGDHGRALELARDLIADDVATTSVYRNAAESAERAGKLNLAISYAKMAYRKDRSDLTSALRAMELISSGAREPEINEWRSEILDNIAASSTGALGLCLWALAQRDEELFVAALKLVAATDKSAAVDLMEDAFGEGMPRAIAASVPIAVGLGRLAPELADRRAALLQAALKSARDMSREGQLAGAHCIARPIAALAGVQSTQVQTSRLAGEARQLMRELIQQTRDTVRAAYDQGDPAAVIRAGQQAGPILEEDGKTSTLLARSLHAAGQAEDALALLKRVRGPAAESFLVRRWTARLAVLAQDYATALEMYGALRESNDPALGQIRPELDRFFEIVEPRALKKLSLLGRAGEYSKGLQLAAALQKYIGPRERTERELARMFGGLRAQLKRIEEGEGDLHDREAILRQMVAMKPADGSTIRRLALELMRQSRFLEAGEYWSRLLELDPDNDSAERNRARCVTLAKRRASASGLITEVTG